MSAVSPLRLGVVVGVDAGVLRIDAELHNESSEPWVVNVHPDDGTRSEVMEGRAYTELAGPDLDTLLVALDPPPPPPFANISRGLVSLSRLLAPGESTRIRLRLPVPVVEWNPYAPEADPEACRDRPVQVVTVRTRAFPKARTGWVQPGPVAGTYWAEGADPVALVQTVDLPGPVTVAERTDDFWRRSGPAAPASEG